MKEAEFKKWWATEKAPELNLKYAPKILAQASTLAQFMAAGKGPLDRAVSEYQRENKMGKNDRAILGYGVYGFARNRACLKRFFDAEELLVAGFLDHFERGSIDVSGIFGRNLPGKFKNLDEARGKWIETLSAHHDSPPSMLDEKGRTAFSFLFSVPEFWLKAGPWDTVGEAVRELCAGRRRQSPHLRANTLKTTVDEVRSNLERFGLSITNLAISNMGLKVDTPLSLASSDLFREGMFELQDEGSQLISLACEPKAGEKILDLCAGGSGKALAIAAITENQANITSYDKYLRRLLNGVERIERAGAKVEIAQTFNEVVEKIPFDTVLVDAPCSSTGTMRRNPDVCWRVQEQDIASFAAIQGELLTRAALLVRKGGKVVYSTCSLMKGENYAVVEKFLSENKEFSPISFKAGGFSSDSGVSRLPMTLEGYEGDGYFIAVLRRNDASM